MTWVDESPASPPKCSHVKKILDLTGSKYYTPKQFANPLAVWHGNFNFDNEMSDAACNDRLERVERHAVFYEFKQWDYFDPDFYACCSVREKLDFYNEYLVAVVEAYPGLAE